MLIKKKRKKKRRREGGREGEKEGGRRREEGRIERQLAKIHIPCTKLNTETGLVGECQRAFPTKCERRAVYLLKYHNK
jgi:hypothetical protein